MHSFMYKARDIYNLFFHRLIVLFYVLYIRVRVTSLEQLSLAEFSGEYARPKVYENGHKNVPGI